MYIKRGNYFIPKKKKTYMNKYYLVIDEKKKKKSNNIDNLCIEKWKKNYGLYIVYFLCHFVEFLNNFV